MVKFDFITWFDRPLKKREILERGMARIGEEGYNLIWKNCEHFANFCRYDVEISDQVRKIAKYLFEKQTFPRFVKISKLVLASIRI
jgi:hypothetical protein